MADRIGGGEGEEDHQNKLYIYYYLLSKFNLFISFTPAGPDEADRLGDGEGEEDHEGRPERQLLKLRHLQCAWFTSHTGRIII